MENLNKIKVLAAQVLEDWRSYEEELDGVEKKDEKYAAGLIAERFAGKHPYFLEMIIDLAADEEREMDTKKDASL